jgi:trehalose 2-sulfotransferase
VFDAAVVKTVSNPIVQAAQSYDVSTVTHRDDKISIQGFAICTTPRSGSNLIGQMCESTGKLGRPLEYFNGPARRALESPNYPDDVQAQVTRALESRTSNNVYGLKLFPWHLAKVMDVHGAFESLVNLRFVRLKRRDRLAQAISWVRASQTRQYRSTQTPHAEAYYDGAAIARMVSEISRAEASWDIFFALRNLEPKTIEYEAVAVEPAEAVQTIAGVMEVSEAELDLGAINLNRQSDALTAEWRERFLGERLPASFELIGGTY